MKKDAHCKETRICAFCRFWYDPTNSAIKPKMGYIYEFDNTIEKPCSKNGNLSMPSWHSCNEFQSKF